MQKSPQCEGFFCFWLKFSRLVLTWVALLSRICVPFIEGEVGYCRYKSFEKCDQNAKSENQNTSESV